MTTLRDTSRIKPAAVSPHYFNATSAIEDLKACLAYSEPDVTIIDARDRRSHNRERIAGSVPVPLHQLPGLITPILERDRKIYVYGETDETTAEAAAKLRHAGFLKVAELKGGLEAWKAIGGAVEGTATYDD